MLLMQELERTVPGRRRKRNIAADLDHQRRRATRHLIPIDDSKLLQHLSCFAFFDAALVGKAVTLLSLPDLVETDVTTATTTVMRTIREHDAKLVLIDGFQSVEPILDAPHALRLFLASLSTHLSYSDATVLATVTGDARDPRTNGILTAADLLIGLNYQLAGARHQRSLEVVKQRGRAHLPGRHAYRLDGQGVTIFPRIEVYPPSKTRPPVPGRAPYNGPKNLALARLA